MISNKIFARLRYVNGRFYCDVDSAAGGGRLLAEENGRLNIHSKKLPNSKFGVSDKQFRCAVKGGIQPKTTISTVDFFKNAFDCILIEHKLIKRFKFVSDACFILRIHQICKP